MSNSPRKREKELEHLLKTYLEKFPVLYKPGHSVSARIDDRGITISYGPKSSRIKNQGRTHFDLVLVEFEEYSKRIFARPDSTKRRSGLIGKFCFITEFEVGIDEDPRIDLQRPQKLRQLNEVIEQFCSDIMLGYTTFLCYPVNEYDRKIRSDLGYTIEKDGRAIKTL